MSTTTTNEAPRISSIYRTICQTIANDDALRRANINLPWQVLEYSRWESHDMCEVGRMALGVLVSMAVGTDTMAHNGSTHDERRARAAALLPELVALLPAGERRTLHAWDRYPVILPA